MRISIGLGLISGRDDVKVRTSAALESDRELIICCPLTGAGESDGEASPSESALKTPGWPARLDYRKRPRNLRKSQIIENVAQWLSPVSVAVSHAND